MIKNPTEQQLQALDFNVIVYITVRKEKIKCFSGNSLPDNLRGTTFKASRTGSHTIQPNKPLGGYWHDIVAEQIEEIYTKDEDTEYFV